MVDLELLSERIGIVRDALLIIWLFISLFSLIGITLLVGSIPDLVEKELQDLIKITGGRATARASSTSTSTGSTDFGVSVQDQLRIAQQYTAVSQANPEAAALLESAFTKSNAGDVVGMVADLKSLETLLTSQGNTIEATRTHEILLIVTGQQVATDAELQTQVESLLQDLGE